MMRRLIAGFLTVCMMLSICPPEAFVVHTSATDISVTEPVVTEPVVTEPVVTEPVVTEPVTEPVVTEPAPTEATEAAAEATEAATEATELATEATEAATETTEPTGETTEPTGEATEPTGEATEPTGETTEPTGETTEPIEETSEPTEETSEPTEETTEPEEIVDYKTMTAGSTITLVASGEIGGYWSSYNPNLATVEGKIDGQGRAAAKVTGLAEGTVTVAYVLENHVEKWIITITPAPTEAPEETTEATEATEAATEAAEETTEATEAATEAAEETTEATEAATEAAEETTEATEAATEAAEETTEATEETTEASEETTEATEETTEAPEETTEATEETTEAPAEQIGTLTADRTSIHVGETARLTGTSSSWLCNYSSWSTDRPEVATVSADGVVTAVSVGDVTVTHEYCTSHGLITGHHLEQETLTIHVAEAVQLESLEIKGAAGLAMGETLQLSVRAYPQGTVAEVEWGSSDESVLTVDQNGLVTPLKEGSAFVIASCGIIVDYREITVSPALNQDAEEDDLLGGLLGNLGLGNGASTFALTAEKTTIAVGESTTLTGSQNARYDSTSGWNDCGFEHQWSVRQDPDECANVTHSGNTATVKGLKPGTVTIDHTYCTSTKRYNHSHSTTKETITITVLDPVVLESLTITGGDTVQAGETIQLTATKGPQDATVNLVWSSSNESILTVDENGVVTGVKAGIATVTVEDTTAGKTATHDVMVTEPVALEGITISGPTSMGSNQSVQLTATMEPDDANDTLVWSSDNGEVLTVDQNGLVSSKKTGNATITVTNSSGRITASHKIAVSDGDWVYVYTKVTGNTSGLVLNSSGWYTLGRVFISGMPSAQNSGDASGWLNEVIGQVRAGNLLHEHNQSIKIANITFNELTIADGANDYVSAETKTWHLNGTIDVKYLGTVVYRYLDGDGKKLRPDSPGEVHTVGETITKTTADAPSIPGYTCYNVDPSRLTIESSTNYITYRYAKQTYTVTYTDGVNGEVVFTDQKYSAPHGSKTPEFDGTPTRTGYTFIGWSPQVAETVTANATYTAQWEKTDFNITYRYEGTTPTDAPSVPDVKTGTFGTQIGVEPAPTLDGYTFSGWTTENANVENGKFTMPAQDVTFTGSWTANSDTGYTVKHYQENLDGTYPEEPTETENLAGTTGTTATATEKSYPGFALDDEAAQNVKTGTITGDGSLVLKLYYKRVNDLSYTVHYYWNGTQESVLDDKVKENCTFGDTLTEDPAVVNGCTPVSDDAKSVTIEVTGNEITFYYYKNVTLGANSDTKVYNGETQTVTGYTGAPEGVTFGGVTASGSGTNVGKYFVEFPEGTVGTKDTADRYIITEVNPGTLTITPKSFVPDPDNTMSVNEPEDHEYDGLKHIFEPVVKDGDKVLGKGTDYTVSYDTGDFINVKTIVVTITGMGNYNGEVIRTYQITRKAVTVKAVDNSKTYGATDPTLTATVDGTLNGDEIVYTLAREAGENVGNYTITPSGEAEQGNYTVTYQTGDFEITKNSTLTVSGKDYTGTYDGKAHGEAATASVTEGTAISYSVDDGKTWTEMYPTITDVGTVNVKVKAENSNYVTAEATYTLTVNPKAVTVTADNNSKVYGAADPKLTAKVEGTLNGDEVVYSLARAEGENVGHYVITPSGDATQGNYTITYRVGDFEITKSDGLTVTGESYDGTYDGKAHGEAAEASVTEGTTISYSVDGGTTWTETYPAITDVGTVNVTVKAENSNYVTAEATYTLTVNSKAVTVKAVDKSKTYGAADPELTATVTGTLGEDTVAYTLARETGENVGKYTITPSGAATQGNYTVTYQTGDFEITKNSTLTVSGKDYTGTYDGKTHGEAATASVTEGTTISYSVDGGTTWTETYPTITDVGTVNVTVKAENSNYVTAEATYTLTVNSKAVTVKAVDKSKTYGAADPELTATVTGTLGEDTVAYTLARETGENVGKYTITPSGAATQGNYTVTYQTGDFEITKNSTLTVSGKDYTGTYDGKTHGEAATASVTEGTTISYSVDGGTTWTETYPAITDVGTVNVTVKAENSNYVTAEATYTLTVNSKAVTVKAVDKSKTYGAADPELTATVTGTLGEDTVAYTLARETGENVGKYTITPSGAATQGNYTVTYQTGDFEITKNSTLTVSGKDYTGTYDGKTHGEAATASVTEGTTISYSVDGGTTWTETYPTITDVGTVNVTVKAENSNYVTAEATYTLTVNSKAVTVKAVDKSKTYGAADPELTATVTGTLGEDTVAYTLARETGENVGKYTITPSGAATQGNYTVTYQTGDFEITKNSTLTVSGKDYTGTYDGKTHGEAATASVTEGTTISYSVDDGKTWTETYPTITDVGTVNVKVKAENSNYVTAEATYTLTVNPKAVTVTADNNSKVYGAADPKLTAKVEGTLNGDEVVYSLARAEGENVGHYVITPSGDATQGNYTITYRVGDFEITKSDGLTVTGESYDGTYDGKAHGEAAEASVTEGTTISYSVDDGKTWTETYPTITDVGTVNVKVKAENSNYVTAEATYTLTVNPKAVTVTADNNSKVYGAADPKLTAKVEGTLNGDEVVYSLARAEGENVGHYVITPSGDATQGNYTITYRVGDFEITKSDGLTVTGESYDGTYDGKAHGEAAEASVTEGTTISYSVDGGTTWTETYPAITDVGTVNVTVKAENSNYVTAEATYTLTVNPKAVTVTADNNSKVYGAADPKLTAKVEGTLNGDEVVYSLARAEGENVGHYVITPSGDATQGNYTITYRVGDFEITKSDGLTVTGESYDGTYDGKAHGEAAEASVTEGTTISYSVDGGTTWTETYPAITDVGTVNVTVKAENSNYVTAEATYTLTVNPKAVTVTADNNSKVYGAADPKLTAKVEGTLNGDEVVYSLARAEGENVGHYVITPSGDATQGNYTITYRVGDFEITKSDGLTVTGESYDGTYDGKAHGEAAEASVTEGTTISYSVDGGTTWTETYPAITDVGTVNVTVKAENSNYVTAEATYTLTVNPKAVTVTADNNSKVYGAADPKLTAKVEGTLNGDEVVYSLARAEGENVGHYVITPSGDATQGNYTITYRVGDFEITKSDGLTVTGESYDGTYDGKAHGEAAEASVTEGTTISYSVDGGTTWTETYPAITDVGTVNVTVKAENSNYVTAEATYTLTVNPKAVTVTADNNSKVYGAADPKLTAKVEGTLNGDEVVYSLARAEGENVGHYVITPSGDATQGNYTITYRVGDFEITKSDGLTVTGESYDGTYDGKAHGEAAEASVTEGTTISYSVDGGTTWTETYPAITDVGTVNVKVKAENSNYVTAEATYTLTVNERTVTLTSATDNKEYDGTALTNNTVTVSGDGFVGEEGATYNVTGSQTLVGSSENTFTYTLNEGTNAKNYDITTENGTLTVTDRTEKYEIAVEANSATVKYDGTVKNVTGFKTLSFTVNGLTYTVEGLEASATGTDAGTYTAKVTGTEVVKDAAGNDVTGQFTVNKKNGTLVIDPVEEVTVTITGNSASKVYDGSEQSVAGFTTDVTDKSINVALAENAKAEAKGTNAGEYTMGLTKDSFVVTSGNYSNIKVNVVDGKLTITPDTNEVSVAITGNSASKVYTGSEQSVTGFATDVGTKTINVALKDGVKAEAKGTNVGEYTMGLTEDSFVVTSDNYSNIKVNVVDGWLKINPVTDEVVVTIEGHTGKAVYDGNEHTVDGYDVVNISNSLYKDTYFEATVDVSVTETNVGEYPMDLDENSFKNISDNFTNVKFFVTDGKLTIISKSIVPDPTDPDNTMSVNEPEDHEYDGAEHKFVPVVTDGEKTLTEGVDYEVSYSTEDFTNVKTITVTIEGIGNYTGTVTKTYDITKRTVIFTGESDTRAYTGRPISLTNVAESDTGLVKGHTSNVEYLAEGTSVGTHTGTITAVENVKIMSGNVDVTKNYAITTIAGVLTITATPASENITIVGTNTNKVYDGDPLAAGTAIARAEDGSEVTIEYSFNGENWTTNPDTLTATDVTEGTMVQIRASAANYSGYATSSETITITKRPVTVTTETASKVYDGVALTAGGKIEGIVEGETVTVNTTGSQTEVGSSDNTYELAWGTAKESNYTVTDTIGTLTVTKQSINPEDPTEPDPEDPSKPVYTGAVVNNPVDHEYDGAEHIFEPVVKDGGKTLTEGTDYEVTYSTENFTDVTGTITVTITGKGNYAGTVTKTYEITPKAVTVSTETASKVYDGVALTAGGEIKGIVEGETVTVNTTGSQTEVGSSDNPYELVWGTAEESNYTLVNETIGKLTVVPQSINPEDPETPTDPDEPIDPDQSYYGGVKVGTLNDVTYNGESQVQRPTVTDKDGNALTEGKDYTLTWSEDTTNAGTVTMTVAGIGNYEGTVTRTYQINPRAVTLTSQTAAKAYDGTPLTGPNVAVTGNGFVAGEVTDVRANGTIINAGSVENTITYTMGEGFRPENYQITLNPGTLTVNPADQGIVTVTGNNDTFTWTGAAQTVTGYTHNGADRLITVNIDDAANAVATGVAVGHYDMGLTADNFTAESPNFRNVTVEVVDGYLDIMPINATVTVTVRGSRQTAVYDGQPHTAQGYEVVSAIANTGRNVGMGGINLTLTGEASVTGTAVGTYAMGLTAEDFTITSDIYAVVRVAVEDGELVITPASIVPGDPGYNGVNVGTPADVVYNGENQQVRPDVTGANGNALTEGTDYTLTWSEDTTNVGTVSVTVTGIGNYEGTVTRTYRITPRNVVLTSETAAKIYDGTPLTRPDVAETGDGFVAGEVTNIAATGTITGIGTAENTITYTTGNDFRPGNYQVTLNPGTLTVTAQSIVPGNPNYTGAAVGTLDDVMYNGQSQQLRPIVTAADGSAMAEGTDYTLRWSADTTNAGTVVVTVTGIGNYSGSVIRTYRITPRTVTLTSQTAAKAYDGTPLTRPNVTVTGNGFVAGEVTGVRANGTITNAGSVVNTIAYTVGNGFRPGNYQVTLNPGTLTINPAAQGTVTVTGSTGTFTWTGDARTITGYTHNGAARLITVNIDNADNASVSGTDVGHYNMGLTAANFTAASPNYRNVTVEVVDGYLDIEPVNAAVTVTVRGNRETVAFDGQPHTVQGYEVVSAISNNGANVGLNSINLTFTGDDSVTGTEAGTYSMGLTAADFTITSDIYASVRVVVQDGELVITPAEEPEQTTGPEDIEDETVPLASGPEDIPDEEVPLAAAPAWALVNLILSILTVLGSLLLLIGFIGKKKEEVLDEDGNAILDAEGNSLMNQIHKHGGWRLGSLLPAILSVIAFILTEDMRNPMILVDRWTLLMVIIAVVQILVAFFSKKETEKSEEETAVSV